MSLSRGKPSENTKRVRALFGDAVRRFRVGWNTTAALKELAPHAGMGERRAAMFYYNEIFSETSDEELDRASQGFVDAMLWLGDFWEARAKECRAAAFAEKLSRQQRQQQKDKAECEAATTSRNGLAA